MVTINREVLERIFDDKGFIDEAYALLNMLIDSELEKDDDAIDFDFIDACSRTITEICSADALPQSEFAAIFSSKTFKSSIANLPKKNLSSGAKLLLIAAVLLASTISVSAAVGNITGNPIIKESTASVTERDGTQEEASSSKAAKKETEADTKALFRDESEFVCAAEIPDKSKQFVLLDCEKDKVIKTMRTYQSQGEPYLEEISKPVQRSKNCDFDEEKYIKEHCRNTKDCTDGAYHSFGEWITEQQPTCTELGRKERHCTACGAVQECPISATDKHDFIMDGTAQPPVFMPYDAKTNSACEDGRTEYSCRTCDATRSYLIPAVKYAVVDTNVLEFNGKKQHPKLIAVLDRNGREIPASCYTADFDFSFYDYDGIKSYDAYSFEINFDSPHYGENTQIRVFYSIIPPRTQIKGIASQNGAMTVFWSKGGLVSHENCNGYEIQYSTSKNFSNAKEIRISGLNASERIVDGLVSGQTYYVRIRTVNSGTGLRESTLHSYWSDVRKIKIK